MSLIENRAIELAKRSLYALWSHPKLRSPLRKLRGELNLMFSHEKAHLSKPR
jgi:hypothetical protein